MRRVAPWLTTVIAFVAFISLGLPDAVLGVAFPDIRAEFDLPSAGIGFILISSSVGYFLSSTFAGTIMRFIPLGWLLAISTSLVTVGLIGYSLAPFFPWFMLLAFGIGAGSGAVDTALNAYASEHFSAARMNWLHGFFGIGAMIGPLVMTGVLTSGGSWQRGYQIVGVAILVMAVTFILSRRLWDDPARPANQSRPTVSLGQTLRLRLTMLQVAVFLVYCGIEVMTGQWGFTILRERFGASQGMAGFWVGMFWGALAAGRLVFGPFADRIGAALLVRLSLVGTVAGAAAFLVPVYAVAVVGMLLLGLGLAAVFPTLISLTSRRLPAPYVTHAIGLSVGAAVVGGASMPTIAGLVESGVGPIGIVWMIAGLAVVVFLLSEALARSSARSGELGQPVGAGVAD